MRLLRVIPAAVLLLFLASDAAHAGNGQILMTWGDTCTPLVTNITPTAGPVSLMFSEIGNDQAHTAYQVRFVLAADSYIVPDAWRFDAEGCQGSPALTINHMPPASTVKSCPSFAGLGPSIQIKSFRRILPGETYDPLHVMRGVLANTYPEGFTTAAGTRYFLAQFVFDHTRSVVGATTPGVDCGGFEAPVCVQLLSGDPNLGAGASVWMRAGDGAVVPFDPPDVPFVTIGGPLDCVAVPVRSTTWGAIKSQYRD